MRIEHEVRNHRLVVRLQGELDMSTAEVFRQAVDTALAQTRLKDLVIDLSGVSFIDSSGLGALLGRYRRLAQNGGKMSLLNPAQPVRPILELSGFYKIMSIYESEPKATGTR